MNFRENARRWIWLAVLHAPHSIQHHYDKDVVNRADEGEIPRLEIRYAIADKPFAGALRNQNQLIFRMEMPGGRIIMVIEIFYNKRFLGVEGQMFENRLHLSTFMID